MSLPISAQENDSTLFSVHYMARLKRIAEQKECKEEEKVLEVGKHRSCFYGRWKQYRKDLLDSLKQKGASKEKILSEVLSYPTPEENYAIYNNFSERGKRTVTDCIFKDFYYEEDIDTVAWQITDADTTFLGYHCNIAKCYYRNHTWTAYYTNEIPVSLGPWKLIGLPGLVLAAYDGTGDFSFECIEIRNDKRPLKKPYLTKATKCSRQEIKQMFTDCEKDPEAFSERLGYGSKGMTADGKPIIYKPKTAIFID